MDVVYFSRNESRENYFGKCEVGVWWSLGRSYQLKGAIGENPSCIQMQ